MDNNEDNEIIDILSTSDTDDDKESNTMETFDQKETTDYKHMIFKAIGPKYGYSQLFYKSTLFESGDDIEILIQSENFSVAYGKILFFIKEDSKVAVRWYYTVNNIQETFGTISKKYVMKSLPHELYLSTVVQSVHIETINKKIIVVKIKNEFDYYCRYSANIFEGRIKKREKRKYAPYKIYSKIKAGNDWIMK